MCNNLPKFKMLSLSANQFEGEIPRSIWKCIHLETLSLSYNNFSGIIPREIGTLRVLTELYLGYTNSFQGTNFFLLQYVILLYFMKNTHSLTWPLIMIYTLQSFSTYDYLYRVCYYIYWKKGLARVVVGMCPSYQLHFINSHSPEYYSLCLKVLKLCSILDSP